VAVAELTAVLPRLAATLLAQRLRVLAAQVMEVLVEVRQRLQQQTQGTAQVAAVVAAAKTLLAHF
jgi:hypothetical protein